MKYRTRKLIKFEDLNPNNINISQHHIVLFKKKCYLCIMEKVKYTPGTSDGLVGKTYKVEIVKIRTIDNIHISYPMLSAVQIKYEDGKTEWVNGKDFVHHIDLDYKAVENMTY